MLCLLCCCVSEITFRCKFFVLFYIADNLIIPEIKYRIVFIEQILNTFIIHLGLQVSFLYSCVPCFLMSLIDLSLRIGKISNYWELKWWNWESILDSILIEDILHKEQYNTPFQVLVKCSYWFSIFKIDIWPFLISIGNRIFHVDLSKGRKVLNCIVMKYEIYNIILGFSQ
jgi:hypothetical protein